MEDTIKNLTKIKKLKRGRNIDEMMNFTVSHIPFDNGAYFTR